MSITLNIKNPGSFEIFCSSIAKDSILMEFDAA
jgi:hypothetical protein